MEYISAMRARKKNEYECVFFFFPSECILATVSYRIREQKVHIHELCGWGAVVYVGVCIHEFGSGEDH